MAYGEWKDVSGLPGLQVCVTAEWSWVESDGYFTVNGVRYAAFQGVLRSYGPLMWIRNTSTTNYEIDALKFRVGIGKSGVNFKGDSERTGTGNPIKVRLAVMSGTEYTGSNVLRTTEFVTVTVADSVSGQGITSPYPNQNPNPPRNSNILTDGKLITFPFSTKFTLSANSAYCVSLNPTDVYDNTGPADLQVVTIVCSAFRAEDVIDPDDPIIEVHKTLAYNANIPEGQIGSGSSTPPASIVSVGEKVTVDSGSTLKRYGHRFKFWTDNQGGTLPSYAPGSKYQVSDDTTLYAQWDRNILSFNSNGGSGGPSAVEASISGETTTVPTTQPTRPGYKFIGWNTEQDGSGTSYSPGGSISSYQEFTLFAQWEALLKLTYDYNDGTGRTVVQECIPNVATAIDTNIVPPGSSTSQQYTTTFCYYDGSQEHEPISVTNSFTTSKKFKRWRDTSSGTGNSYGGSDGDGTIVLTADKIIYAQYEDEPSKTDMVAPTVSRTGYSFVGWYTAKSGGTKKYNAGQVDNPTSEETYYGMFRKTVTITFDNNAAGGTITHPSNPSSKTFSEDSYYGSSVTCDISDVQLPTKSVKLYLNTNTKSGQPKATIVGLTKEATADTEPNLYSKTITLTCLGFSTQAITTRGGLVSDVVSNPITVDDNKVLYAVWQAASTGTLPSYGSSGINRVSNSEDYRLDLIVPWTSSKDTPSSPAATSIYKNTTIYAYWQYRITLDGNGGYFSENLQDLHDVPEDVTDDELDALGRIRYEWKRHGIALALDFRDTADDEGTIIHKLEQLGYTPKGFSLNSSETSADFGLAFTISFNDPTTFYVIWEINKYRVIFKDGYTKVPKSDPPLDPALEPDVLVVVNDVSHGGSVEESRVPVVGGTYRGRVFKYGGPYKFKGWTGSYQNITSDTILTAIWEFAPIWICVRKQDGSKLWVPYKPEEA